LVVVVKRPQQHGTFEVDARKRILVHSHGAYDSSMAL
jgi:hypothetical protein